LNKYKRYIPIVALVLVALGINLDQFGIDLKSLSQGGSALSSANDNQPTNSSSSTASNSSSSSHTQAQYDPNINLWHIFEGEINRSGKPVGFHSRPDGQDPANARIVSIRDKPNRSGVYTATIEINDSGEWKSKFSSFFPDSLSRDDVIQAVLNAYNKSANKDAQPFEGPSGLGFSIQGYTSGRGGINTAFPVFVRGQ
jgi:hypothetical protein